MTVRDAIKETLSLTGATSICGCHDGGENPLILAALTSLNRAMQEVWMSPSMRHQLLEPLTVTFPSTAAVDLPANVQTVVGPVRWNAHRPIQLAATATEFRNYYNQFCDEHWDEELWDDLVFGATHNVSGGFPWYDVEFYLPLWDDRAILIWFDNAASITAMDLNAATSPGGFALNSRTISVRVELPDVNTHDSAARALVLSAIRRAAGQWIDVKDDAVGGKIRCYRRRPADTADWQIRLVTGVALSLSKGPRVPAVAWAEELKATSPADDLARVRLHLQPPAAGTVHLNVFKEPPSYIFTDLDCDGDGANSTTIELAHKYSESLLLPLALHYFGVDHTSYLPPQSVAAILPSLEASAAAARAAHGLSSPNAPQTMQRTKTTQHGHA